VLEITATSGTKIINSDRMWHFAKGLRNETRSGRTTDPDPARAVIAVAGRRGQSSSRAVLSGFDTLGTLTQVMSTSFDYCWFVLTQKILEREFPGQSRTRTLPVRT
jgi:hypothetical protein